MAIDGGLPRPCCLMLIYPMLDPETSWAEHKGETNEEEKEDLSLGWTTYLGDRGMLDSEKRKYAKLLELSHGDLHQLPPTYIDVGEHDYFLDEVNRAISNFQVSATDVTA